MTPHKKEALIRKIKLLVKFAKRQLKTKRIQTIRKKLLDGMVINEQDQQKFNNGFYMGCIAEFIFRVLKKKKK
jgi:hypothetical protein